MESKRLVMGKDERDKKHMKSMLTSLCFVRFERNLVGTCANKNSTAPRACAVLQTEMLTLLSHVSRAISWTTTQVYVIRAVGTVTSPPSKISLGLDIGKRNGGASPPRSL